MAGGGPEILKGSQSGGLRLKGGSCKSERPYSIGSCLSARTEEDLLALLCESANGISLLCWSEGLIAPGGMRILTPGPTELGSTGGKPLFRIADNHHRTLYASMFAISSR